MADPWMDRLSEYRDGDLEGDEHERLEAHLRGCGPCRERLARLNQVVAAARELPAPPPPPDLWPGIARLVGPGARRRRLAALASAVAAGLLAGFLLARSLSSSEPQPPPPAGAASERFMLVLHEDVGRPLARSASDTAAIVGRYRDWSRRLARRGHMEGGDKLADAEGFLVRRGQEPVPRHEGGGIAGFFILRARDYAQAFELLRDCPHLELGHWIEVRRIEDTSSTGG